MKHFMALRAPGHGHAFPTCLHEKNLDGVGIIAILFSTALLLTNTKACHGVVRDETHKYALTSHLTRLLLSLVVWKEQI